MNSGPIGVSGLLLAAASRLLSSDKSRWGLAMSGELQQIAGRNRRWRFALGCVRAILLTPPAPGEPGRVLVAGVVTAALACVSVVAGGLVRYPGLWAEAGVGLALAAFLCTLGVYVLAAVIAVAPMIQPRAGHVRLGLLGGVVVAALWTLVGAATSLSPIAGLLPVVLIPLTSLLVGASGARRGWTASAGRQVAVVAAVVAGLLLFLGWVGMAVSTGGRPYDPGLLRDFQASGAGDLATYAVDDNLGAGMMLLLLVPLLTVSLGSVGAAIAVRIHAPSRRAA